MRIQKGTARGVCARGREQKARERARKRKGPMGAEVPSEAVVRSKSAAYRAKSWRLWPEEGSDPFEHHSILSS